MRKQKILLTAFEPFGGESINPAWEVAQKLVDKDFGDLVIKAVQIPTVFGEAIEKTVDYIKEEQPNFVVSLGQAGGRTGIDLERVAINVDDATKPDNKSNQPIDEPIVKTGPAAYFSTLPIRKMVEAVKAKGIPANISNSAGTFVCNHLMYGILHYIHTNALPIKAGFIHLPYLPEQAVHHKNTPSMSLNDMVSGIEIALLTVAS